MLQWLYLIVDLTSHTVTTDLDTMPGILCLVLGSVFGQVAYSLPTDFRDAMKQQANRVGLTTGRVDAFICPPDKTQAFLWDTDTPTLALRETPTGRKTYIFESRLNGATIRINIGILADWPIEKSAPNLKA